MSKANSGRSGPAGWRRGCLSMAVALLLAGCAAQTAYREGQTLLAEDKVDAGLAKIQEAMTLDPSSAEYRIAYVRAQDRYLNASLARAERAFTEARYDEAEGAYRRALVLQPGNDRALAGLRQIESARRFKVDLSRWPLIGAVDKACAELDAFQRAAPTRQPDAG